MMVLVSDKSDFFRLLSIESLSEAFLRRPYLAFPKVNRYILWSFSSANQFEEKRLNNI